MDENIHLHGGDLEVEIDDKALDALVVMFVLVGLEMLDRFHNQPPMRRIRDSALSSSQWVVELINGHRDRIFDNLRMKVPLFMQLCAKPHPTQRVSIHESVAIAWVCLSHNERHRVVAERFQHSLETVDRHLQRVLRALIRLGREIVRPSNFQTTHPRILNSEKFWPWFKVNIPVLLRSKYGFCRKK